MMSFTVLKRLLSKNNVCMAVVLIWNYFVFDYCYCINNQSNNVLINTLIETSGIISNFELINHVWIQSFMCYVNFIKYCFSAVIQYNHLYKNTKLNGRTMTKSTVQESNIVIFIYNLDAITTIIRLQFHRIQSAMSLYITRVK